jgi:thiamine transport system substrate-binding protein
MVRLFYRLIVLTVLAGLLAACAGGTASETPIPTASAGTTQPAVAEPAVLNVMTHDSFAASEAVIRQFEAEHNIKLNFVKSGDAGSALNRAVLSKGAPMADVFYGVDNSFLSRALEEDIFEPYASPLLAQIPAAFKLDPENRALPVDYGDVCLNYDKAYFAEKNLPVPQTFEDLAKPEYQGLLVVQNPATSSPGLSFLLATIAHFGEAGYAQYWKDLRANGVVVANDWEAAYYTNFSGSSGKGAQPLVVSYNSSPVAEVVFAEQPPAESPTGSITAPGMCYRQVEFVGILKGTQARAQAEAFIDFMLGTAFQEDMPLQMFVYPVNQNASLPEPFLKHAQSPEQPASLDPAQIAANREKWIQAWDEAVLR